MTYFSHIFKQYNDGNDDKLSTYTHDTLDEAIAMIHTQFGQNVGADTISHIMVTVLNSEGGQYEQHTMTWTAETVDDDSNIE